jgi:DNA polymerase IV
VTSVDVEEGAERSNRRERDDDTQEHPPKRPRLSEPEALKPQNEADDGVALDVLKLPKDVILVLKLAWLLDSLKQDVTLPVDDYLLYQGRKLPSQPKKDTTPKTSPSRQRFKGRASAVLARAAEDQQRTSTSPHSPQAARRRTDSPSTPSGRKRAEPPTLYRETTSEHDVPLPPIPDFLHTTYSCQRPSPVNPPNAAFIKELKAVRKLRLLQGDQVGVRAYSTSIASLAAYPFLIQRPQGKLVFLDGS